MRSWLPVAALLALLPSIANAAWPGSGRPFGVSAPTYVGPGDLKSGAQPWYGLRAYNGTYAAGLGKAVNVKRASDSVACDLDVAATGGLGLTSATCNSSTQGGITYAAFVGTDATASCTISGTSASCSGASATIHTNDPVSGVGLSQPCVVTATNGSTTATVNIAGTSNSCGTVGSAETLTFQVASTAPTLYDQSGNGVDQTSAAPAQFLPLCANGGTLPCLYFITASSQAYAGTLGGSISQPWSTSGVVERTGNTGNFTVYLGGANTSAAGWTNSADTAFVASQAASNVLGTAVDNIAHSIQGVVTGSSSFVVVDGSPSSLQNGGSAAFPTAICVGALCSGGSITYLTGYVMEIGVWPGAFSPTEYANLHANDSAWWGTPGCPFGNALPDGCPAAQATGSTQVANFFTGYTSHVYAHRPAWNVAGVDYPVGYAGSLTDASTASLPACASRTGSGSGPFAVTINSAPCTLTHLDFSLHNGICLTDAASGGGTVLIDNSNFGWGTNCNANGGALFTMNGTAPVVVQYSSFTGSQTLPDLLEALMQIQPGGTAPTSITAQYNAFLFTVQADIQLNEPTTLNVSFNYAEGIGFFENPSCCHGDWVIPNWSGTGVYNDSFDTVFSHGPNSGATTFCYITAQNGAGTISGHCNSNIMVANGNGGTQTVGSLVETDAVVVNTFSVSNNWMDMSDAFFYFLDQSGSTFNGPITCAGNLDLITGSTVTGTIAGATCH